MAIIDCEDSVYCATEQLILPVERKRYPVSIHSHHWQLRALTGLATDNVLCFPGGSKDTQIHTLNLDTSERFAIRKLQFSPRCLTAGNGWICCGGEYGEFSAIKVYETGGSKDTEFETVSAVPAPIGPYPKSARFARERVNCVTLWFPPAESTNSVFEPEAHIGAYDEPVGVLANNDKTVTVVGLNAFTGPQDPKPLCTISYPDYVNRAVISPDGKYLAAVLDDPYLYVHKRVKKENSSSEDGDKSSYTWVECAKLMLKGQDPDERSEHRGSFALTFSPSGVYLAAGTQHGVVSVYDTWLLDQPSEDPLITTFNSSRPGTSNGAIRDMAFSPGKYGLLAWTEDRGRVGIANVQSIYTRRQIVDLRQSESFSDEIIDDHSHISLAPLSDSQYNAIVTRAFRRETEKTTSQEPPSAPFPSHSMAASEELVEHMSQRFTIPLDFIANAIENGTEDNHPEFSEYINRLGAILPEVQTSGSSDVDRRRVLASYIREVAFRRQSSPLNRHGRENTSGMVWSTAGDKLFVGSEDGIYEMHVNPYSWQMKTSVQYR